MFMIRLAFIGTVAWLAMSFPSEASTTIESLKESRDAVCYPYKVNKKAYKQCLDVIENIQALAYYTGRVDGVCGLKPDHYLCKNVDLSTSRDYLQDLVDSLEQEDGYMRNWKK